MFDAYCPTCAKRHLIFASQIRAMDLSSGDAVVSYVCWCGADASWTISRLADEASTPNERSSRTLSLAG